MTTQREIVADPEVAETDEASPAEDRPKKRRAAKGDAEAEGGTSPRAARIAARRAAEGNGGKGGKTPQVIEVRPMAAKARMRSRHWGLVLAFLLMVITPVGGVTYYLYTIATDQYASTAGFAVRKEDVSSTIDMMGGLTQFMGGSGDAETDMLYEFIQSQNIVTKLDARLDLRGHYEALYDKDPAFALKPGGTIEDLVDYWGRIVTVAYDQGTGLVNVHVRAFSPEMAQRIAEEIIVESQVLVNDLNLTARNDSLKYAEQDLADAVTRLKDAREALVHFRSRTQIVDPESDLRGRMGVLNSLQQQLAQALIEYDLIAQNSAPNDPRVVQAQRRIDVIQERITEERRKFAEDEGSEGLEAYPALLAEYERLSVDREFAEQSYTAALASLDLARANSGRQSRYLAAYLRPTFPERAEFPNRIMILSLSALFAVLFWAISALMYYALRDRK